MNISFIMESPLAFMSGIWMHRIDFPGRALSKRGHGIKHIAIGNEFPEKLMEWTDVAVFGRSYPSHYDPVKLMREMKGNGKRVIYDMDDNFWAVEDDNPSVLVSNANKDQYEAMIAEADAVITPSKYLAKIFKKHFKKTVHICPNLVDLDEYHERPHGHEGTLVIGYMGAASHWNDLLIVTKALSELSRKHDFLFTIYGMTGEPLEAAIYTYNKFVQMNIMPEKAKYHQSALDFYKSLDGLRMYHVPFMPPELHAKTLAMCDFDIGIAPLRESDFNKGKSCIKYYEYAAVGTTVLASNVLPYSEEVNYTANNTEKDWYNKLEKLIVDAAFRKELGAKQKKWVVENRTVDTVGLDWELALQKPSKWGLKVLNQKR